MLYFSFSWCHEDILSLLACITPFCGSHVRPNIRNVPKSTTGYPWLNILLLGCCIKLLTYLVPPVPSGTLGDELSPSGTIAGSISRVTPVHTHHLQIFFQRILPCPHWSSSPPPATFLDPFQSQTSWSGCRKSQNVPNKSSFSGR